MGSISSRLALGFTALLVCGATASPARAAWTLDNTNGGNGELVVLDPLDPTPFGPFSWVLVGSDLLGDTSDGDDIETDTTITDIALVDGPLTFTYLYGTDDDPEYDPAGYFINDQRFQLSEDCGCSPFQYGTIVLDLHAGDSFGFYVHSADNRWGSAAMLLAPGELDSAFPAFPEPASWAMMVGGFGFVGGAMRGRRRTAVAFG